MQKLYCVERTNKAETLSFWSKYVDNHAQRDLDVRFQKITRSRLELSAPKWNARTHHHSPPSHLQGTACTPFIYSLKPHQKFLSTALFPLALKGVTRKFQIWRVKWETKEQPLWVTLRRTTEAHLVVPSHSSYHDRTAYKDLGLTLSCIAKTYKQSKQKKIFHTVTERGPR